MLERDLIAQEVRNCLAEMKLHLYDLRIFKKEGELILMVEIDESLDLDHISKVSEEISGLLDRIDTSEDRYILDVSSAGIEREIRDKEELVRAIGSYIHLDLQDKTSLEGDLEAFEDGKLTLVCKEKNLKKKKVVNEELVQKIRYAVKF